MMDLADWKADLPEQWQVYVIIDPLADNKPLEYWYRNAESTDAWPLYAGTEFSDDILSGPWLLPLAQLPGWESWWQEQETAGQATGILLASEHEPAKLLKHWQSLLLAGLDGEEVLFRYYDPRILAPMLYAFTEDETRRFLGPTNELVIWHNDDWFVASPYPETDLTEHDEPWWRMQEPHFVGQPGHENTIADNLEDWLWQYYPELTREWLKTNNDLRASLHEHYQRQQAETIPLLWQPSWLLLNLFGRVNWWPEIRNIIRAEIMDEQNDVMVKVMTVIERNQLVECGA